MSEPLVSFGAWVRLRRQALVLTRDELAGRIGVAEVTVRKVEADERRPSPQVAALLAQHLGLDASQYALFVQVARGVLPVERLPPPIPGREEATDSALPSHTTLPSGTVTFLFTDIEGSTRRWEEQPNAMRTAVARHDTLLREAVEAHGGHVFKTIGDAICAAFAAAPDALAAALAGQRAILAVDWGAVGPLQVRMALHSGTATAEADDYLGPPLNRVARLLSAGHGGQVLLSLATHELVRDHLPPNTTLRHLGEHRLKDLARPEAIYQLDALGLPSDFPALTSLDARRTNLPTPVTELIGREREVGAVVELLGRARLVTLTGPGGTGKTRLALAVGAELLEQFSDGVWFVDLSPVTDPQLVAAAITQALGLPQGSDIAPREQLIRWLAGRQPLLILDNYEQVIEAALIVADALRAAPGVRVLATSRVPLRIEGERELPIAPLSLPANTSRSPDELNQSEAVRLFVERARGILPSFQLRAENARAVAQICAELDGLPLAIELAAARIRLYTPEQLLSRLTGARLQLLTGGRRDLPARQQTIRAAIDWSYRLLAPDEQRLFARLGTFVGGWTFEAAEAICGDAWLDVVGSLERLVEHSLVRRIERAGGVRYGMLETIHEYALARLDEQGERAALRRRHADYIVLMAEQAEPQLQTGAQLVWLARLDADEANIGEALAALAADGDDRQARSHRGLRLSAALGYYWVLRGQVSSAMTWLGHRWTYDEELDPRTRLRALFWLITSMNFYGKFVRAHEIETQVAMPLARRVNDPDLLARILVSAVWRTDPQNRRDNEEALELLRMTGDRWMRVHAHVRGWIQRDMLQPGDPQIQEVLGEARHIGDRWLLGQAYATLARMLMLSGHHEQAQSAVEDANACFTKLDHSYMLGTVANIRSNLAWFDADIDLSLSWMRERLARDEATGNVAGAFYNCAFQSVLLIRLGDAAAGERLLAQAQALATPELRAENLPIYIIELLLLRGDVATARARIDAMRRAPRSIHLYGGLNDTDMVESLLHLMTGELAAAEHGYRALREGAQAARNFATIEWSIRLGDIASHSGDPSAAQEHFDAAIGLARRIAHLPLAANSSAGYARALARLGSPHDGCRQLALALPIFRRMRLRDDLAYGGETAALLCAACGAPAQAVRLLAAAAALREQVGIPLWPVERPEIERCLAESRAALDDAAFDAAWQAGRALTWEQAADDALAWLTAQERPPQHEGVGAG